MRLSAYIATLLVLLSCAYGKAPISVTLHLEQQRKEISPLLWGVNFLNWFDRYDLDEGNKSVTKKLKEMGVTTLRFPGGSVAENYHWETNKLDNDYMYPFAYDDAGQPKRYTDFDEFMQVCQYVGAEPVLVANTRSWIIKGEVEGNLAQRIQDGAADAAAWVQYCKTKGYKVKYWEIGNEAPYNPFQTREEYGDLANVYIAAMKAVDPDIIIGVNGDWRRDFPGLHERLLPDRYPSIVQMAGEITSRETNDAFNAYVEDSKNPVWGGPWWWAGVANKTANTADMIIPHHYISAGPLNNGRVESEMELIRQTFRDRSTPQGRTPLVNLSEYNLDKDGYDGDTYPQLVEVIRQLLESGVEMAQFWPLDFQGMNARTLLIWGNKNYTAKGQVFKQLANNIKGHLVSVSTTGAATEMKNFASYDGSRGTLVLNGLNLTEKETISLQLDSANEHWGTLKLWSIKGAAHNNYTVREETLANDGPCPVEIEISPREIITLSFSPLPEAAKVDANNNGIYDRLESGVGFVVTDYALNEQKLFLEWASFPERSYQVEISEDLVDWQPVEDSELM